MASLGGKGEKELAPESGPVAKPLAHRFNCLIRRSEWWIAQTKKKMGRPKQEEQEDNVVTSGNDINEVLSDESLRQMRSAYKDITLEELGEKLKESEAHDEYGAGRVSRSSSAGRATGELRSYSVKALEHTC